MIALSIKRERGQKHVTDQYLEGCHLGKSICIMFVYAKTISARRRQELEMAPGGKPRLRGGKVGRLIFYSVLNVVTC